MKKALALVLFVASAANAANWTQLSISTEGTKSFIDTKAVYNSPYNTRILWAKYTTPTREELVQYELFCQTKLVKHISRNVYIKGVFAESYSEDNIWKVPAPDSLESNMVDVACSVVAK